MQETSSSLEPIRSELRQALAGLDAFDVCSVLDYPDYFNIGDHLIWLGTLQWLTEGAKAQVRYVASANSFNSRQFELKVSRGPIFLSGGGSLGDLWPSHQQFREKIIASYKDRKIVILPQSIYFKDPKNLERTKKIFNTHPDLTVMVRSKTSENIARQHFLNCRVILAPDMAFELLELRSLRDFVDVKTKDLIYLCRHDQELDRSFSLSRLGIKNMDRTDWCTMTRVSAQFQRIGRRLPFLWRLPLAERACEEMFKNTPFAKCWQIRLEGVHDPSLHQLSLKFVLAGVSQLSRYKRVMSNRLHGHILSALLEIPHVILPDRYEKNRSFFETWTSQISTAKFVTEAKDVKMVMQELARLYAIH